ncbi:MAG TPA: hypothetical protein VNG04_01765 [Candidatus Acidoferrum sp.]|nr:hypothetical protein [Candidatus Acidoferrum sp.]
MKPFVVSACLAVLLGCGNPTGTGSTGLLVRAAPPVLDLTNQTAAPIYSFVIDRGAAAYTDWAPCTNPAACSSIKAGATSSLTYAQIAGYSSASTEAIVYWWHLVPDGTNGFRPDSVRGVVTSL